MSTDYAAMPTISESNGWQLKEMTMQKMVWLHEDGVTLRTWHYPSGGGQYSQEVRLDGSLIWTDDKPTQPGWFWWRVRDEIRVIEICEHDGALFRSWDGAHIPVEHSAGQWAGPIAEPVC